MINPVTTGNEKKCVPPFDISPDGRSRRNDHSRKLRRTSPRTIGESTGDSIIGGEREGEEKNTVSVRNLFREKRNCSVRRTKSGVFGEGSSRNGTRGLLTVLEEQLTTAESISTSRRHGSFFS